MSNIYGFIENVGLWGIVFIFFKLGYRANQFFEVDVISFLPSYSIAHARAMLNDDLIILLDIRYTVGLKINFFVDLKHIITREISKSTFLELAQLGWLTQIDIEC